MTDNKWREGHRTGSPSGEKILRRNQNDAAKFRLEDRVFVEKAGGTKPVRRRNELA